MYCAQTADAMELLLGKWWDKSAEEKAHRPYIRWDPCISSTVDGRAVVTVLDNAGVTGQSLQGWTFVSDVQDALVLKRHGLDIEFEHVSRQ